MWDCLEAGYFFFPVHRKDEASNWLLPPDITVRNRLEILVMGNYVELTKTFFLIFVRREDDIFKDIFQKFFNSAVYTQKLLL